MTGRRAGTLFPPHADGRAPCGRRTGGRASLGGGPVNAGVFQLGGRTGESFR